MAKLGLVGRDGRGVRAKDELECLGLAQVERRSGAPVRVDQVDILRCPARAVERPSKRRRDGLRHARGQRVGPAGVAVPNEPGEDPLSAPRGVVWALEREERATFAGREAVVIRAERSHVAAWGEHLEASEAGEVRGVDRRVRAAGQDRVGLALDERPGRLTDGLHPAHRRVAVILIDALRVEVRGGEAEDVVRQPLEQPQRVDHVHAIAPERDAVEAVRGHRALERRAQILALAERGARADEDAEALGVDRALERGVEKGALHGRQPEARGRRHQLQVLAIRDPLARLEIGHHRRDRALEGRAAETQELGDGGAPVEKRADGLCRGVAEGGDHADAGDRDVHPSPNSASNASRSRSVSRLPIGIFRACRFTWVRFARPGPRCQKRSTPRSIINAMLSRHSTAPTT